MTPPVRLNRLGWYLCAGGRILRSRLTGARPFFISHLVTRRCFARCPTCLWRGEGPEEKDTGRIVDFYRRAAREGFFSTTFWGGEPLLREDLPEILRASREAGLVTGLITNGYLLPRRYREIGNQLDFLIVSLDIPSAAHDRLRGVEGLFAAAREGVALVREANPRLRVMINTVASVYAAEHVEEMARFARREGLTVTFESVNSYDRPAEGAADPSGRPPPAREQEVFRLLGRLRAEGLPINNSRTYLGMFARGEVDYRCHANDICMRVEPDGTVSNCADREHPLGNAYYEPLESILGSERLRELRLFARTCRRCVDTGVIESSLFWELRPEVISNTLRLFLAR